MKPKTIKGLYFYHKIYATENQKLGTITNPKHKMYNGLFLGKMCHKNSLIRL